MLLLPSIIDTNRVDYSNHISEVKSILKQHWKNAIQMNSEYGYDQLSRRNSVVYCTVDSENFNLDLLNDLDFDSNVMYVSSNGFDNFYNKDGAVRGKFLKTDALSSFACEYSVFLSLAAMWKEIEVNSDQVLHDYNPLRLMVYLISTCNIIIREFENGHN